MGILKIVLPKCDRKNLNLFPKLFLQILENISKLHRLSESVKNGENEEKKCEEKPETQTHEDRRFDRLCDSRFTRN